MGVVFSGIADEDEENDDWADPDFKPPSFYNRIEGPQFTALDFNKQYIIRHYGPTLWASTVVRDCDSITEAWRTARGRLRTYFREGNQKQYRLPRTCPILCRPATVEGNNKEFTFTFSQYIPRKYAKDPPAPKDNTVFLQEEWPRLYYILQRKFPIDDWKELKLELQQALCDKQEEFNEDLWNVVFYEAPGMFFSGTKLREIWFAGKVVKEKFTTVKSDTIPEDD